MYLKVHENYKGRIIAACDAELIGKVFTHGDVVLDLDKYRNFYIGDLVSESQLVAPFSKHYNSANLVGKKVISILVKNGILDRGDVLRIKKIPHAQLYFI